MRLLLALALGVLLPALHGQTLLSVNQPVTAGSFEAGNSPTNGNDNNFTTRWAASSSAYPQFWQVDLGGVCNLSRCIINWYSSASRAYGYQIYASPDGTNYSLLVDDSTNAAFSDTTNALSANARYLFVYVTGCTAGTGYASFYECQVYGTPLPPLIPYVADANTLFLFHLDEAAGGSIITNLGSVGGNAYTVSELAAGTAPPVVTNVLGALGYPGMGSAAAFGPGELIGLDYNHSGAYDGDVGSSQPSADALPMASLNMGNGGRTPWTIEALIQPSSITSANQEIICTDSSANNRGFQFRINSAGQLELNLIALNSDILTPIPTLAADPVNGFVSNTWYHVAATYDGTNVVLYWTKASAGGNAANPISTNSAAVGTFFGAVQGPLTIGNENRGAAGEYFQGLIDEVRISSVARTANQMLFQAGAVSASPTAIAPANPVYAGTAVTLSSTVNGLAPISYFWQGDGGSSGANWTNLPGSLTNAYGLATAALPAGVYQYRLVVTNATSAFTNLAGTLNLLPASGPLLSTNTVIKPAAAYPGTPVQMSVGFAGSQPISCQWFFTTNGGGTALIPGATGTNYFLASPQTNNGGSYYAVASNNPPGLGPQVLASTPAVLTVLAGAPPLATNGEIFCEFLQHPEETTLSALTPRFGWIYQPSGRGDSQRGYQLIVASGLALAGVGTGDVWDSGLVTNAASINVPYGGPALQPGAAYYWRVRTLDGAGTLRPWSGIQQFTMAARLADPLATGGAVYLQPGAGSVNCYPPRFVPVAPVRIATNSLGHLFVDFGNDAFGFATVHLNGNYSGSAVNFGLGELASNNVLNTSPGATIRYWSGSVALQNGNNLYTNRSTTPVGTISPPVATYGLVSPFRYLELSGLPAGVSLTTNDLTQERLQTEFDDNAATFASSSAALNQVWGLCKYSMKALSFDGIYVDGDRERTPYEADTYLHMLSAYGVYNDFTTPRCTFEYLVNHLTWPTEWKFHLIFAAWADYQQTGDAYLMTKYYSFLTNTCLMLPNAGPNGLVLSYPASGNSASGDIIDWYRISGDGIGNIDGYVAGATNAVINAFYYRCLTLMSSMAQLTGHAADAGNFAARAGQVYTNYNSVFWNSGSQSYIDSEGTAHSCADANFFPLAFGLVPPAQQAAVVSYLHSRIAAKGAMPAGVYGAQYLLEGLFLAGDADTALGLITTNNTRSWLNMINIGSTVTGEAWSTADKANEDWNHAWGAAPGNLIPRYVLGVRPLAAGYGRILIQPQLGQTLSWLQGTVPTVRGPVSILATNAPGQFQLLVNIPGNVTATVMLPAAGAAAATALVDGAVVSGTLSNNWLTVTNIGSGQHALWVATNATVSAGTLYANWAGAWFGTNSANAAIAGQNADPDGDGVSNFNEFIAGTNPLEALDVFQIGGIAAAPLTVTLTGHAGRHYILQHTFTLAPAAWVNADTETAAADNQVVQLHDPLLNGSSQAFLRVAVTYP